MTFMRLQHPAQHSRTRIRLLLVLERVPLASKALKTSCLGVPMLLSPPPAIVAPQLSTKQDVETLVDYIYTTRDLTWITLSPSPPFLRMVVKSMALMTSLSLRIVSCS